MIPVANPDIGEKELSYVIDAIKSGWISSQGEYIRRFENKFAKFVGTKYGIAVSSGTAALHLALLALGIKEGDEVLVPDLTFASPANMVVVTGARPVFVDVTKTYWCIDPEEIRRKITNRTKAIIVVHLYGNPAKMDEILEIANDYGLYIIEDAAEAHGAEFKGKKVGSLGHVGIFSFYGNKIITTGEGGMVVTNDQEIAEEVRLLRDHGMRPRYWHIRVGFNYRMTNIQAAIGLAQLERINELLDKKRRIAKLYSELLSDVSGILPHPEMRWAKNSYWLYSILIEREKFGLSRDQVMQFLYKNGIETRKFFYPLHIMPIYKQFVKENETFRNSTFLHERGLNLPSGPKISDEEILKVCETLLSLRTLTKK